MSWGQKSKGQNLGKAVQSDLPVDGKIEHTRFKLYTRSQITELLFENCPGCHKMSAIPQGVFASHKVSRNIQQILLMSKEERQDEGKNCTDKKTPQEEMELTPHKYNSKLMNSIWGLYNRYSVHNLKKIIGANEGVLMAAWGVVLGDNPSTTAIVNKAASKSSKVIGTENGIQVAGIHS